MSGPLLDHIVVNVQFDMDRAESQFSALGFELTPRGFHTLGSVNHLMVFETDYLELLGLPRGAEVRRPELTGESVGLRGLVFKADDVDEIFSHLQGQGMAGDPPRAFSRPVTVDGVERSARFRTVSVRPGVFAAGRVYFCEHQTPDLVWRSAWQRHRNRVTTMRECIVVADEPEREGERYSKLLNRAAESTTGGEVSLDLTGSRLLILEPKRYAERFGALASNLAGRRSIFGALSLGSAALCETRGLVEACADSCSILSEPDRLVVRVNDYNVLLEFTG